MNALDLRFRKLMVRVGGEKDHALHVMRGRLVLFKAVAVLCFGFMALRASDLMVLQALPRADMAIELAELEKARASEAEKQVRRADIVDRNGELLATSLKMQSLYADPKNVLDKNRAAEKLAEIFPDMRVQDLRAKLNLKRRFIWLKRGITPAEQAAIEQIGEPGLSYSSEDYRFYPQGRLTSHLVGMVNRDGQGTSGLERAKDQVLHDASWQTSIDLRIQHILHREIGAAMRDFDAKAGAGLVMDVENGELLAAVSLPDFDPNMPPNPNAPEMFNRYSQGVYELGSTFKIFSTAALFEFNKARMSQRFDARKPIQHGRFKIRDYHAEKRIMSLPEVFMHSSNIGSAKMAEQVGTERIKSFYRDLGLMDAPDFDLKEVARPLVPSPWREINTLTTSYGHGIAISPLQLASAVSSVVNGGHLIAPRLTLSDMQDYQSYTRVVSQETSKNMRALMRLAVSEGTGMKADVYGLMVGGKTGTAEKPSKNGRGYDRKRLISSFVAAFPIDAPRYLVYIMVDEPKGQKESFGYATGGWVAAPAAGRVISAMAPMLGIMPELNRKDPAKKLQRYIQAKAGGHNG